MPMFKTPVSLYHRLRISIEKSDCLQFNFSIEIMRKMNVKFSWTKLGACDIRRMDHTKRREENGYLGKTV